MIQRDKQAKKHLFGRRLAAAVLAVIMGVCCIPLTPIQAKAEDAGYELYPIPHTISYTGKDYIVRNEVNLVVEDGIDNYTVDRLEEVLALKKDITYTKSNAIVNGKTNILVGIKGSNGYVDTYAQKNLTVSTENLFGKQDSYVLDSRNGVITVLGKDTDSSFYGLTTLYHVFAQMDSYTIREFHVEDWADVSSRGFIEGYYGNPWKTEDRVNLMKWGGYYKLNSYFYAPKDDPKHNGKWREPYSEDEIRDKIIPLAEAGNASKCRFVYALHPFMNNPVRFNTPENYAHDLKDVQNKFTQVIKAGVRQIAILADDAKHVGDDNYIKFLKDMCDWLETMKAEYPDLKMTLPFCTQEYMSWGKEYYSKFPENVQIVMTGGKVWGEVSNNFTTSFTQTAGRGPYMWINWPCTDNSKKHLIMGGYTTFLQPGVDPKNIQGIVLNPMQQSEPSKVAIFGNACYSWNIWENEEEANQAWFDSFKYVDHNSAMETEASAALREMSKHMMNQAMDGRVQPLQESVKLKVILNDFKSKLAAGTVTAQDVDKVMAEFYVLQAAAKTYRAKAGDQNVKNQIVYWLDCWDDTTAAALAYLNGVKAVLIKDTTNALKYNSMGKAAFSKSKAHGFHYVNHTEYAEVGVQHIVPFINTLADYVSRYAELAMDPNKVIGTFITSRKDNPVGDIKNAVDGDDSTFISYQNPNAIKAGEFVGVVYNRLITIEDIRFLLGAGKNHFDACKLQYTEDGTKWKDIPLVDKENSFTGIQDQHLEVVVKQQNLPKNFKAMGIRLIATANNRLDAWLEVHEIQVNALKGVLPMVDGTFSASEGLSIKNKASWDVLKDKKNGTEVHLSNTGDKTAKNAYIQYTFREATKLGTVHFVQGASQGNDVIRNGSLQYLGEDGQWHLAGHITNAKVQTFKLKNKNIVTTAVRIINHTDVPVWWRVGEFRVEGTKTAANLPIQYNVIKTDIWKVVGGSEANLHDGNDGSYVYYDPDGNGNPNNINNDNCMVDQFLGYNFGRVVELKSIHAVVGNAANPGDKIVNYAIETSMDNQTWTPVPGYDNYRGANRGVDVIDINLETPINAQYIRIRNLEQRHAWTYFSEFSVKEVVHQEGDTEYLYTNVKTDILSNRREDTVSLTTGTVNLNKGEYIGVDLGNIKAVTKIDTSALGNNVALETSMNGVTWTACTAGSGKNIDARYVRAVAKADGVALDLSKFEVTFKYVGDKTVSSDFDVSDADRDIRIVGGVENIFDGKLDTNGTITGVQLAGRHITFDLGRSIHFNSLRYYIAENNWDYLRHAKVEISSDLKNWHQVMVIGKETANTSNTTVAKEADYLTHDSNNPGYMYAEATNLNKDARYIRITPLSSYNHRWVTINELMINGGAYISAEVNRDIISESQEEPNKIPSNALDKDCSTTYLPSAKNSSFTYRVSAPEGVTILRLVQLGTISNATVSVRYVGENTNVTLGTMNQAINEFVLAEGKTLESVTVTWKDIVPEIAEIATSTDKVVKADKTALKAALDATHPTNTWITDSINNYNDAKAVGQEIYKNSNVTQAVVDSALGAIKSAVADAELKVTNMDELQALVDNKLSNDATTYTTNSYYVYSAAVENLKDALANADNLTQAKADKLKASVEEAQAALEFSIRNRELAELGVEGYAALVGDEYTTDSFSAVTAAKEAIDALVAQDKAAQNGEGERVNPAKFVEAKAAYDQAVAALRYKADKSVLQELVAKAETLDLTGYTSESIEAFNSALKAAKDVLADETIGKDNQNVVDEAVEQLKAAIRGLSVQQTPGTDTKPNAPQTGDDSNMTIWVVVAIISLAGAVCAAAFLLHSRKRGSK